MYKLIKLFFAYNSRFLNTMYEVVPKCHRSNVTTSQVSPTLSLTIFSMSLFQAHPHFFSCISTCASKMFESQ